MRICHLCAFDRCDDHATTCRQCGGELAPLDEDEHDFAADSAYFHYLVIPKVGKVELVPGKAFRLGRDRRNEFVMPKVKSEQVAELFWTEGYDEVTIRAMGDPRNPAEVIKVEGIRLSGSRTLKGGEELQLGQFPMSYQKRTTPMAGAISAKKIGSGGRDPGRGVSTPAQGGRGARGALDPGKRARPIVRKADQRKISQRRRSAAATPASVLKALEKTKATGTLRVRGDQGRGWVTVMNGTPRHAAFAGTTGPGALVAILRMRSGRCQMDSGLPRKGQGERLTVTISQALARLQGGARQPKPAPRGRGGRRPRR